METELDKEKKEHGEFVRKFVPEFLKQSIQLDRLGEHIRNLES